MLPEFPSEDRRLFRLPLWDLLDTASHYRETLAFNIYTFWREHVTETEREEGVHWYRYAGRFASDLAREYGKDTETVAAFISALSPSVSWDQNKNDAITLAGSISAGLGPEEITASTYSAQVLKAYRVFRWEDASQNTGQKTEAFARNIAFPTDSGPVTVDRHALTIALGEEAPRLSDYVSLTAKRYKNVAEAYRKATARINEERRAGSRQYLPHEVQAATWTAFRRSFREKYVREDDGHVTAPF